MRYRATLTGTIEAKALLQALPEAVSQTVLQGALKDAVEPFAEAARDGAPRSKSPGRRGHAADSIRARVVDRDQVGAHVSVAPMSWAFYLYFFEFGTLGRHTIDVNLPKSTLWAGIRERTKRAASAASRGKLITGGIGATGFMRRAFDAHGDGVTDRFVKRVDDRVVAKCREISRRAG